MCGWTVLAGGEMSPERARGMCASTVSVFEQSRFTGGLGSFGKWGKNKRMSGFDRMDVYGNCETKK